MNQRIRQLTEQALKHPDTDNDGLTVFDNDELEKFAELIVRECANQLPRISEDYYTGDGIVEDAQKLILEHFGVEE